MIETEELIFVWLSRIKMKDKMDRIIRYLGTIVLMTAVSTLTLQAEPSVYGFSGDDSRQQRQSSTSSSRRSIATMQQKIAQQDERIDGLITIIEGLSASLNELQMREVQGSSVNTNFPNNNLLKKLAGMIDEINANYVSKEELTSALGKKQYNKHSNKTSAKKSTGSSYQKGKASLENKSNATLYSEGVRLFVKKRYAEAQKRFAITDTKRYKPAASNYYLGEIAYYTKKYEDAIFYFKKSAGLYDKASYIDTLLLHTAVSLEKTGDKGQARAFYENIIVNYKGKKSAKIAKERLKKL